MGRGTYKGIFHPRAKAALGNNSAQTRGEGVAFTTTNTSFTVFTCNSGDWRITETFDNETDAVAWVDEKLNSKPDAAEPAPPEPGPEG